MKLISDIKTMKTTLFIFGLILVLLILNPTTAFAGPTPQSNLAFEELVGMRIEKVKETMTEVVAKLSKLSQDTESNASAFFAVTRTNKDASVALNTRLQWMNVDVDDNGKTAFVKWTSSQSAKSPPSLVVPSQTKDKIAGLRFDAAYKTTDYDLKNYDFKWMAELMAYDHWNLEDNSPIAFLEKIDFFKMPYPEMSPFLDWTKMRLIKGLQDNNITQAIDECLHLGRLVYSTETAYGQELALSIQETVTLFTLSQKKYTRYDLRSFQKQKILFPAMGKALSIIFYDPRTYVKLLQLNNTPGFCAALNTAASNLLAYRPLLEEDIKPIYLGITNILNSTPKCRWKLIKKLWAGGDSRLPQPFAYLSKLGLKARKNEVEILKKNITPEEYRLMMADLNNPRWPQYYIYLLDLKKDVNAMFSDL